MTDMSRQKSCPCCGSRFSCGAQAAGSGGGCWCSAVPILNSVPMPEERSGVDCLCPACLVARVGAQIPTAEADPGIDTA